MSINVAPSRPSVNAMRRFGEGPYAKLLPEVARSPARRAQPAAAALGAPEQEPLALAVAFRAGARSLAVVAGLRLALDRRDVLGAPLSGPHPAGALGRLAGGLEGAPACLGCLALWLRGT